MDKTSKITVASIIAFVAIALLSGEIGAFIIPLCFLAIFFIGALFQAYGEMRRAQRLAEEAKLEAIREQERQAILEAEKQQAQIEAYNRMISTPRH